MITIYTDGAAIGNPGAGGYGIVMTFEKFRKEISQGYKHTTNNRMELLAVIVALETLKNDNSLATVYSDSKYVIDAINKKWVFGWLKKGFVGKKNEDLWRRFLNINKKHSVTYTWVKGHAGNPENERCDVLATTAAKNKNKSELLVDEFYEKENDKTISKTVSKI